MKLINENLILLDMIEDMAKRYPRMILFPALRIHWRIISGCVISSNI